MLQADPDAWQLVCKVPVRDIVSTDILFDTVWARLEGVVRAKPTCQQPELKFQ